MRRGRDRRRDGDRLWGTPIGQLIDVIEFDDDKAVVDVMETTLPMEAGRFRPVVQGPDGSLYTAVDEGTIHNHTPSN